MSLTRLHQVTGELARARQDKRTAEKIIEDLTPVYYKLIDQFIGEGQVSFEISGTRYGRVIAERATFDVERFCTDHPEIASRCTHVQEKVVVDEEALNDYLSEHPEDQELISQYVKVKVEPRWKAPVPVSET